MQFAQSILRVLKLNESRKGISAKNGKPWEMQDAECLLLSDTGEVEAVGVLNIPRALMGKVQPGDYIGSYALQRDMQTGRIEPALVGLVPYAAGKATPSKVPQA